MCHVLIVLGLLVHSLSHAVTNGALNDELTKYEFYVCSKISLQHAFALFTVVNRFKND